jgi:hypothetical protein
MGKLSEGVIEDVRIKVPRSGGSAPCGAEMIAFITCLDRESGDEGKCGAPKLALSVCMQATRAVTRGHKMPINFHLKQFLRNIKK